MKKESNECKREEASSQSISKVGLNFLLRETQRVFLYTCFLNKFQSQDITRSSPLRKFKGIHIGSTFSVNEDSIH